MHCGQHSLTQLSACTQRAAPFCANSEVCVQESAFLFGLPLGEVALLMSPVIAYGLFSIYRTSINPQVFFRLAMCPGAQQPGDSAANMSGRCLGLAAVVPMLQPRPGRYVANLT
jgi:hypothetical protein